MKPTPGDEQAPGAVGLVPACRADDPRRHRRSSSSASSAAGPTAIGVGVVLACLGGLEVAVREHFAGYRSHTTLLAGTVFVVVVALLFYVAGQLLAVCLAVGAVAFALAFLGLRRAFQRASGGLSFKVGRMRPARDGGASDERRPRERLDRRPSRRARAEPAAPAGAG